MAKESFTAARVAAFKCPPDKTQAFLWDTTAPGLGLRKTPTGKPAYVFQGVYQGKTLRITIGAPDAWSIADAQKEARRIQRDIDQGRDPREQKRQNLAETRAKQAERAARAVTVAEAWETYIDARKPMWGEHHLSDHNKLARGPGTNAKGRATVAGALHYFMGMRLADLSADIVEDWAKLEGRTRPTQARLGQRLLKAFLTWCATRPEYKALLPDNPANSKAAREALGRPKAKTDALLKEQLPAFFSAVHGVGTPAISAYIQCLLLTGARPGELLGLKWADVNSQWRSITIRDKDNSRGGEDGTRTIPLTPYVRHLLAGLPRRSEWVFSGSRPDKPISSPRRRIEEVARVAGVDGLTLHGLRRSFGSLGEWLEMPAGVVAQIQGHKPSATAEKHYRVRPLDLLRVHHEKFEAWILEQAGIQFDPAQQAGALRLVATGGPQA